MSEMDLTENAIVGPAATDEPTTDMEAPEVDAAEQRIDARPSARSVGTTPDPVSVEADPADLAEQALVVELDEDDYR